ncbi:MAG: VapB-type antitoxin [Candidatus Thermoplasmatota archaeon]|nr:VapB-type antitoxin [Candidatus Thermoplasmatota archaeon]
MISTENEVISVRLKKGTREKLKNLGINPSEEVRKYLEDLAWKKDARNTIDKLELMIQKHSKPSETGFAVKSIREDRDEGH